jgi:hypothetical protein
MLRSKLQSSLLLYALAKKRGWEIEWSLLAHDEQVVWRHFTSWMQSGVFGEAKLREVINHLEGKSDYSSENIEFVVSERNVCFPYSDVRIMCCPITWLLSELYHLRRYYEEVVREGVRVEKNLLSILGDDFRAFVVLFEALALSQEMSDPEVRECWKILCQFGFSSSSDCFFGDLGPSQVKEWVDYFEEVFSKGGEGGGRGANNFGVENHGGRLYVRGLYGESSCPQWDLLDELKRLILRYEKALVVSNGKS